MNIDTQDALMDSVKRDRLRRIKSRIRWGWFWCVWSVGWLAYHIFRWITYNHEKESWGTWYYPLFACVWVLLLVFWGANLIWAYRERWYYIGTERRNTTS